MAMFLGDFPHTLDDKGRLIMPSKFRNELGTNFIVTRGLEGCLFVFTESKWNEFTEQLNSKGLSKKDVRSITRFFCSCAMTSDLDKQGRFLVNKNLREFAGIERDVMIIGVSDRIEIWSKEKWNEYSEAEYSDDNIMSEKFDGLDF
ncbi:protein MraZ [Parvimonas sp. KA00067]|uniref:Transcriptional regulator MraZ n=2 Tax=Parvimonas TaxID=543311 RepID=A0ABS1C8P5_9FIRM|nr:division/cell wall cluster transcriptional repressor MraZ [Parvimonas parva]KXB66424.1 protein MraZ [Parvimonas sp. KA00067]MBK1468477.1 division/cell wall cluster transcriptional repressor MraZ [Parvimonas parva]